MRKPRGLPPNAMLEQIEPTHERLYSLMGESLLFQTNSSSLLDTADGTFGQYPRPSRSATAPLVLRLFVHDQDRMSGQWQAQERPRPIYRTQGHLFYISLAPASTAVADLLRGYAFGFISHEVANDAALVRYVFMQGITLAMLSASRQYIGLHAACVVKDETSVILQGDSGAGKSTVAYACARRGYQVVTEDGLLVSSRPDETRLWGLPWKLHLLPETKHLFPELMDEKPKLQINGEWKLEVELEAYFPGSTTTNAAPGLVLFLERGNARGSKRIEAVPFAEAIQKIQVIWPWSIGWTPEMEEHVAWLLARGIYRLRLTDRPDDAVDALDALITQSKT